MPAHNVGRYVDGAIQSVLTQRGASFELLIGDDASTDQTWQCIAVYATHPHVRVRRFSHHRGAGWVRNTLIANAQGLYLAMCDADDLVLPGAFCRLAQLLDRHPAVGVAYGDLLVRDHRVPRAFLYQQCDPTQHWDLLGDHVWNPGTMIRRSVMAEVRGYRPKLPFKLDYDLFLRLAEVTQFQRVAGGAVAVYRRRRGTLSDQSRLVRGSSVRRDIVRQAIRRRYGYRVPW